MKNAPRTIFKISLFLLTFAYLQPTFALTQDEQYRALQEISDARSEVQSTLRLVPRFLEGSVGQGLRNADQKLESAERILQNTHIAKKWFCSIQATFDGTFSGRGNTEEEARTRAIQSCHSGARNNGFFCKTDTIRCQQEQ